MQERAQKIFGDIISRWNGFERKQKIQIIAVGIIVLLSIGITSYLATKPTWTVITDNRSRSEISQIQTALTELGYKTKLSDNGSAISVESKYYDQAAVDLSTQDVQLDDYFSFTNALDVSGMSSTETIKKAALIKNAESELSQRLLMIDGVKKARVTLAIPENNNYFIPSEDKPSASVVIETDKTITNKQAEGMASLIAAGVVGLSKDSIEILNQDAQQLWSGQSDGNNRLNAQDEIVIKRKNEIENKIKTVISPLFDEVKISSSLVFNWDKNKVVTKVVTPPIQDSEIGLPSSSNDEKQKIVNGTTQAAEGIDPNNNQTPEYQIGTANPSSLDVKNTTVEYLYNQKEEITEKSEGELVADSSKMTINVYKYKYYYEDTIKKRGELKNQTWDEFKYANNNYTKLNIEQELIEAAKNGTGINNVTFIGYEIPKFIDAVKTPVDLGSALIYALLIAFIGLLALGIIRATRPDEITDIDPELSVEDLLVSTQLEEQKEAEIQKHYEEINYNKESENKKQIVKFLDEKPEAVAQMLRNWLNDEWE